jgi:hypothetical protein
VACTVLGGGERFRETLEANADIFVSEWRATAGELGEVITRLVCEGRVPQWPNELTNAIFRELQEVRHRSRIVASKQLDVRDCNLCYGTGYVVVAHPLCVFRGKVVGYYRPPASNTQGFRTRQIYSVAVLCDECDAGRRIIDHERERCCDPVALAKLPRQQTLANYMRQVEPHDGVAIWRSYERSLGEEARRESPRSSEMNELCERLIGRLQVEQEAA